MKRFLPILLGVCLLLPTSAMAAKSKKAKKAKENVPEWAVESEKCSGDRDVKSVRLGKEVVYLNEGLNIVSFTKAEGTTLKHDLYYSCAKCDFHKRTPGVDAAGDPLVPSFKHGSVWYNVSHDMNGTVVVEGAPAVDPTMEPVAAPAPVKKAKGKKGKGKKAGKGKGKKVKEAAAPAAEPAKEEPKKEEPAKEEPKKEDKK